MLQSSSLSLGTHSEGRDHGWELEDGPLIWTVGLAEG